MTVAARYPQGCSDTPRSRYSATTWAASSSRVTAHSAHPAVVVADRGTPDGTAAGAPLGGGADVRELSGEGPGTPAASGSGVPRSGVTLPSGRLRGPTAHGPRL